MKRKFKIKKSIITTNVLVLLAITTLIPGGPSENNNLLGYLSICPFSPISTIMLLAAAIFVFFKGNKQKTLKDTTK